MTDKLFNAVTKEEFDQFLKDYPRTLEFHMTMICEPPMASYNDFTRGKWPDSMVATYVADYDYNNKISVNRNYAVLADINAPIPDDGKRDTDEPIYDILGRAAKEGDLISADWMGGAGTFFDGKWTHTKNPPRQHRVRIRDKGTKYEYWSFDDCCNYLRGFDFIILESLHG